MKSLEVSEEKANQRVEEFKREMKTLTVRLKEAENRAEQAEKSVKRLQKEVDRLEGMFRTPIARIHFIYLIGNRWPDTNTLIVRIIQRADDLRQKWLQKNEKLFFKCFWLAANFTNHSNLIKLFEKMLHHLFGIERGWSSIESLSKIIHSSVHS